MIVELVAHDPSWALTAAVESRRWSKILGDALIEVHHIGSTAIPGIMAKPVIDLMPVVRSIDVMEEHKVRGLGYDWRGEFGIPGRRFCTLDDPVSGRRQFNVHVFAEGSAEVARHLAFRDYWRAHPAEALEYEKVKLDAAAQCPEDVLAYNDVKSPWIKACEQRALSA